MKQTADECHRLFTELSGVSYRIDGMRSKLQSILDPIEVDLQATSSSDAYVIEPGHEAYETGLQFAAEDGPETPFIARRPSRSALDTEREIMADLNFEACIFLGPHSIDSVTGTDGMRYLTTDVDQDVSTVPHVTYLTSEAMAELLRRFFNPDFLSVSVETGQQSFDEY